MENISHYIHECGKLSDFNRVNLFQAQDLYEKDDIDPILQNLCRLKQLAEKHANLADIYESTPSVSGYRSTTQDVKMSPAARCKKSQTLPPGVISHSAPTVVASLQDDIKTKNEFKYSRKLEELAVSWLVRFFNHYREYMSQSYSILEDTSISLHALLYSGELLCELANILHTLYHGKPIISKINHSKIAFFQMVCFGR